MCATIENELIARKLQKLEHRMDAYDRNEMGTVQNTEVYDRVMSFLLKERDT